MALFEDLRQLSEQIKKRQSFIKGEEATKQALILPFVQVLGYDVYDPTQVQPEYIADFAKKKAGQFEKVDYAIHCNGNVSILMECKSSETQLEDHDAQLSRYFNATRSVKVAILTNGIKYRFYTDLRAPNVMDTTPFFEFDALNFTERDVETIRPFTRDQFNAETVQNHAEELIFIARVTGLVNELLRNPSDSFIRFLLGELNLVSGRLTARVVDRFVPIVKKAIRTTILDMMTKSIQQEITQPAATDPVAAPSELPPAHVTRTKSDHSESGEPTVTSSESVEASPDELEVFNVVQRICSDSATKCTIRYKSNASYFALNLGKVTHWFLRVHHHGTRRYMVARVPLEQGALLAPGFEVDGAGEGRSRVFFNSAAEIEKLRAFVLVAYEAEAKRHVRGGDSEAEDEEHASESSSSAGGSAL